MSHTTRRKHVLKEMLEDDYELPKEQQQIVRVVSSRGNNLHEVETADEEAQRFLVSMPNKFRKNVWVKRGDYILVEPIEEGDKVKAEICKILTTQHIKEYTKAGVWPARFDKKQQPQNVQQQQTQPAEESDTDNDDDLLPNMNRPVHASSEEESEDDDEDDESSGSDEDSLKESGRTK